MFEIRSAAKAWLLALLVSAPFGAAAAADAPWGPAARASKANYAPQKVVYDVAVSDRDALEGVIDRVSYLNNLYGADPFNASIVVILHGDEIPFFAIANFPKNEELVRRAQSLTLAGPIEFRMCTLAAQAHGLKPKDIHGFVKMVPMADAELITLQQEDGYAYMR
jgi:intracellular sulfur oxidation DsrE/DsrF family protein